MLMPLPQTHRHERGASAIDLIVVLFLVAAFFLLLLLSIPRAREQARVAACQKNLAQIGMALAQYDTRCGHLPSVGRLPPFDKDERSASAGPLPAGPLRAMLETLGQADFHDLAPGGTSPPARGPVPGEIPLRDFICSSDANATALVLKAPSSYRACTGGDHLGKDGAFAPSRTISLAAVEESDGTSFTATFSERLTGSGEDGRQAIWAYASAPGPLPPGGCSLPWLEERIARWHGDAGSSWFLADYPATLYNHSLAPSAPLSCVARDGQSAYMGASSGHTRGVNLLLLDGSVKLIVPTVDTKIWKEFASIGSGAAGTNR
jgi:hypothetical protein